MPDTCWVYVIDCQGHTKIGFARKPEMRLKELQIGCPFPLTLRRSFLFLAADAALIERKLHQEFDGRRGIGEWFSAGHAEVERHITETYKGLFLEDVEHSKQTYGAWGHGRAIKNALIDKALKRQSDEEDRRFRRLEAQRSRIGNVDPAGAAERREARVQKFAAQREKGRQRAAGKAVLAKAPSPAP